MDLTRNQEKAIQNALELDDLSTDDKVVLKEMLKLKKVKNREFILYVDGASDLHSKTAGIGGVIYVGDEEIACFSEPIHDKTNNESEYMALIKGIKVAHELKITKLIIHADSELVVKQVLGEYKVKNNRMKELHSQALDELQNIDDWSIMHVRREYNIRADELSKMGMQKARIEKTEMPG